MILAFDAYYTDSFSRIACVQFESWDSPKPDEVYVAKYGIMEEYTPGEFYKRELPLITKMLSSFELSSVQAIIIDGYVYLDGEGRKGLGAYLYEAVEERLPVIGVAKTFFEGNAGIEVLRGKSKKPLFVTSEGLPQSVAAGLIQNMHGAYRIPDILRILDEASKGR
ncbi:MAG: endonuclease V [Bacteroidia bacterium]